MTGYDRFDVLTALFPFVDLPLRKPRPVLILSPSRFNESHGHVITAMITTGAGSRWPSDYIILDLEAAELSHRSVVRCKIFTLPFASIGKAIGRLSPADQVGFADAFGAILTG
jgi:mRNA interferase MazF